MAAAGGDEPLGSLEIDGVSERVQMVTIAI